MPSASISYTDGTRSFKKKYGSMYNNNAYDPYARSNNSWWNYLFMPAPAVASNIAHEVLGQDDKAMLRDAVNSQLSGDALAYWNSLSPTEQDALFENYWSEEEDGLHNLWGLQGGNETFNLAQYMRDLDELSLIEAQPILSDYVNLDQIRSDAESAIAAENEALLASLNADLKSTSDAYDNTRNALLTQQHQNASQTMDALSSNMSRARRNAIEAGASAGVRIAENVNTLLSAQNQISNQSLETSNQLAQMLVSQRNAESSLRNQWRDIQQSTYDRTVNRTNSEVAWGQARYDQAQQNWQNKYDNTVSESNALQDSMSKYKNRSAYSTKSRSEY